jgi:hypothetical protein
MTPAKLAKTAQTSYRAHQEPVHVLASAVSRTAKALTCTKRDIVERRIARTLSRASVLDRTKHFPRDHPPPTTIPTFEVASCKRLGCFGYPGTTHLPCCASKNPIASRQSVQSLNRKVVKSKANQAPSATTLQEVLYRAASHRS